jgi:hypothetical protein
VAFGSPPLSTPIMESTRPMDIDLPPKDWVSDREKPREPIFGPGFPGALAWLVGLVAAISARYFFLGY